MSKDLKDNSTVAVHTGERQRMSVAEEEKFKDELMKQAEDMIKKGDGQSGSISGDPDFMENVSSFK